MTDDGRELYPAGLYDGRPPRVAGDLTSGEAADSVEHSAGSQRARVKAYIAGRADGATDDDAEVALGLAHQTVSARRRELVLEGLIEAVGYRLTRRGRRAQVWRPVTPPEPEPDPAPATLWDSPPPAQYRDPARFTR